jgi:hypothetical protein
MPTLPSHKHYLLVVDTESVLRTLGLPKEMGLSPYVRNCYQSRPNFVEAVTIFDSQFWEGVFLLVSENKCPKQEEPEKAPLVLMRKPSFCWLKSRLSLLQILRDVGITIEAEGNCFQNRLCTLFFWHCACS